MTSRVCPAFQLQIKEGKLNPAKAKGDFNSFKVQEGQLQAWLDPGAQRAPGSPRCIFPLVSSV